MKTCKDRCLYIASLAALGLSFLLIGHFAWLMLYPYDILEVKSITVDGPVIRGQKAFYTADRCKKIPLSGTVTVYIEDGNTYQLFTTFVQSGTGCSKLQKDFIVPESVPPGIYHLHWSATYHPNALRTITYEYDTNDFELK